jgi:putative Mn2+ efflux pump MntP
MLKLVALVIPLGLDTFAISAALGIAGMNPRDRLRVSVLFTAFEGGMPLVGLVAGTALSTLLGQAAEIVAILVLIALGVFMLLSTQGEEQSAGALLARTRGAAVIGLGLSISLDELAIGFTLGLVRVAVVLAVVLIAAQAFLVAQLGFRLGSRVSEATREGAERIAGAVLILLGIGLAAARMLGMQT